MLIKVSEELVCPLQLTFASPLQLAFVSMLHESLQDALHGCLLILLVWVQVPQHQVW